MIPITPKELALFAEFIHARTGIVLTSAKAYLLENRLGPMLDEYGASNFTEFFYAGYRSAEWEARVVDAISTHETSFFRDQRPFDLLRTKILPDFFTRPANRLEPAQSPLRIWSAGCSTGQEPYSVGMIIGELLGNESAQWDIRITGIDVSDFALDKARQGLYTSYEVGRGVPARLREKYFEPQGELLQIRDDLRAMTTFKKMNLLAACQGNEQYDLVLCRNVAIYFNHDNRQRLFAKIADCLQPGGILIIGSTESLIGVSDRFTRNECCDTVYFQAKGKPALPG